MSDLSNYLENAVIDFFFRGNPGSAITSPPTVYLELYTAVSDAEAGTGTECSFAGYARQATTFGAPSNGATSNSADVEVTKTDAGSVAISHAAVGDADTAGNRLTIIKALGGGTITLNQDETIRFPAGNIDVSVA